MTLSPPALPSQEPVILFEDGEALVLDKPAGLDVTAPRRGGASVEALLPSFRLGFQRPPSIVHRLDRDTSGCLLLARNDKAHKRFSRAFENGEVSKTYLAILSGVPETEAGVVALSLAKQSSKTGGWRMIPARKGKPAVTRWRVLGVVEGRALVEFIPETGRTHQIRVHASHGLGHAIVGDPVYGVPSAAGLLLHAARIDMPREGKPAISAQAPWPARFTAAGFAP